MRLTKKFEALRALLSKQDFRRLCTSQIFGGLGEWLATLALIALVWDRTHSAFVSGIVLALRILPAAVISSALSLLVDRFDRRRVLVACTAGRAAIYGTLPLVGGVAPVLVLALIAEIATLAYIAARDATLPRLVPAESLPAANAVSMASSFAAMPFGSAMFATFGWMGQA
ncbi:MAG TPA: MFS transporter, partial [Actinomycetota bacterium]|nr:MFS transporter [Actinomycetota bacterium]